MYLFNKKDRVFCQHNVRAWSKICCTEQILLLGHLVMTSDRREWWRGAGGRQGCWCWRTRRTWSLSSPSSSSPPPGEACRGRVQKSVEFSQGKFSLVNPGVENSTLFFYFLFNPSLTHQQTMKHCQSSLSEDILNIWRIILEVQIDRYELTVSSWVWRGPRTAGRRAGGTLSPSGRRRAGTAGTPSAAAGAQSRGLQRK